MTEASHTSRASQLSQCCTALSCLHSVQRKRWRLDHQQARKAAQLMRCSVGRALAKTRRHSTLQPHRAVQRPRGSPLPSVGAHSASHAAQTCRRMATCRAPKPCLPAQKEEAEHSWRTIFHALEAVVAGTSRCSTKRGTLHTRTQAVPALRKQNNKPAPCDPSS